MNHFKKTPRAASLLFLFVLLLTACGDSSEAHFTLAGSTMGTTYHITVLEREGINTNQQELQQAIDQQLLLINQQMSTYLDDSELSKFNQALVGEWVNVSANLFDILVMSMELSWLTAGAFDITVGPLVNLWGFGPGGLDMPSKVPDADKINALIERGGFQAIELGLEDNSIRKTKPVLLDLSGIAKGYGVDKVSELLLYAGYTDFMVEIGGELRLAGNSPRGTPWRIAIEQPDAGVFGQANKAVQVSGVAMATSGDYRNYFEQDGKRYSHTINPITGYPIDHSLASITVIADTSAYADGLATALNVLGAEKALQLAEQQGLAIYMLVKTEQGFEARYSEAFKPYLQ
ncbi:FAD:protein FMN transferase [Oceanicoccus sagamiensis]|uniref:FAD:protein FMN transferase n=1 Tax=Oceanicoccus sagamiensis TaxID=716816 RepID=A0A1X9NNW3_9GAMM|nr:FAD:protein FMN transferase [Oceanicoccus sagamiensis]ARN75583.1 thiamin biosynthesis protein ApbE [Oceanicoccus sagamiensis]